MGREHHVAHGVRQPGKRLRSDHALRADLALCTDVLGISHSHFLGGPALWTDLDRAKARAFREWKADVCNGCGTHRDEWDPGKGGDRDAYVASLTYCQGCARLHESREHEVDDDDRARGAHQVLVPRETYEKMVEQAEQRQQEREARRG